MAWENGMRYRVRAVQGQIGIRRIPTTGTMVVEVLFDVTKGPQAAAQVRWQGFLNSPANAEKAFAELRAMGWTGSKLGQWTGIGTKECTVAVMLETGADGKTYPRGAFVRPLQSVDAGEHAATGADVDALNERFGNLLFRPDANGAAPAAEDGSEKIPF